MYVCVCVCVHFSSFFLLTPSYFLSLHLFFSFSGFAVRFGAFRRTLKELDDEDDEDEVSFDED